MYNVVLFLQTNAYSKRDCLSSAEGGRHYESARRSFQPHHGCRTKEIYRRHHLHARQTACKRENRAAPRNGRWVEYKCSRCSTYLLHALLGSENSSSTEKTIPVCTWLDVSHELPERLRTGKRQFLLSEAQKFYTHTLSRWQREAFLRSKLRRNRTPKCMGAPLEAARRASQVALLQPNTPLQESGV